MREGKRRKRNVRMSICSSESLRYAGGNNSRNSEGDDKKIVNSTRGDDERVG
jgi:hypothetical protein